MGILQWAIVSICGGAVALIFIYAAAKLATAGVLHAKRDFRASGYQPKSSSDDPPSAGSSGKRL